MIFSFVVESGKLVLADPEPLDARPQIVEAVPVGAAIAVAARHEEKGGVYKPLIV